MRSRICNISIINRSNDILRIQVDNPVMAHRLNINLIQLEINTPLEAHYGQAARFKITIVKSENRSNELEILEQFHHKSIAYKELTHHQDEFTIEIKGSSEEYAGVHKIISDFFDTLFKPNLQESLFPIEVEEMRLLLVGLSKIGYSMPSTILNPNLLLRNSIFAKPDLLEKNDSAELESYESAESFSDESLSLITPGA